MGTYRHPPGLRQGNHTGCCYPQAAFLPRAALIPASFISGFISRAVPPYSLLGGSHHSHFIDGETEAPRGKWFGAAACESTVEPGPRGAGAGLSSWTCPWGWILVSIPWHPGHPDSLFSSSLYPTTSYHPPIWRAAGWGKEEVSEAWRKERN